MSLRDSIDTVGDRIRGFLLGLAPRGRALLGFLALVFLCGIAWFANGAMKEGEKNLKTQLATASMAQAQVDQLLQEYNALSGQVEAIDARLAAGANFTPLTWLEQVGNEMGIGENIKSIQERGVDVTDFYRAEKFDMNVQLVTLPQTIELLHRLEQAAQAIWISECNITTDRKDRNMLRLRLQISVLKPVEEA